MLIYFFCFHSTNFVIVIFFQGIEALDITKILSQDGEGVYPLPRMRSFAVHPKFNLAAATFAVKSVKYFFFQPKYS